MSIEQILTLTFGKGGTCENRVGSGWSQGEDGYRWMVGPFSELNLGFVETGGNYLLVVNVDPFIKLPELPRQRLTISIDGVPFIQTDLDKTGRYGYRLPPELLRGDRPVTLVFDHPDAGRPSELAGVKDHRLLAFLTREVALYRVDGQVGTDPLNGMGGVTVEEAERHTGLSAVALMTEFESFGENCEFGLVQRRCGAEPLSLLRFSNTLLPNLLLGLNDRFEKLGSADNLGFRLEGKAKKEYIIEEKTYGLVYHTFRYKGEIEENKFLVTEASRLKFLTRKLNEDLIGGNKIFVYRRNDRLDEEEILPLLAAINLYGPNTLFWVVPADRQHPPGSVHWVMPGLLKGYIDRFAPNENAHDLSFEIWVELCVNAHRLWNESKRV